MIKTGHGCGKVGRKKAPKAQKEDSVFCDFLWPSSGGLGSVFFNHRWTRMDTDQEELGGSEFLTTYGH